MANLLKAGAFVNAVVVDMIYCGVVVEATNAEGETFYFAIELFSHNTKQNTKPVNTTTASEAWPDRSNVNMAEALAYWTSPVEKNADSTRKGGAFAKANFSLNGIPIGATLNIEVLENTDFNTVVMVNHNHGDEKPFKAFACSKPSPQRAVDTYIMCMFMGVLYIRIATRAAAGPDYPNGSCVPGGFQDAGLNEALARKKENDEEGGVPLAGNIIMPVELGERNAPGREPRFMTFSYTNSDGEIVEFGCVRGSSANAVVHFVISEADPTQLPKFANPTDGKEIVGGTWMPVDEFLAMSNNPAERPYAPWKDHQAGARAAVDELKKLKLVE